MLNGIGVNPALQPSTASSSETRYQNRSPWVSLQTVTDSFREPLKKKVGGSLTKVSPLKRLAMLQRNALMLRGGKWQPPTDDGTLVRKTVGPAR